MADVEISRESGVQILRLARAAKKNALTSDMYRALSDAFEAGDNDPAIAVHLVTGSQGVFSAGNDIKDFLATTTAPGSTGLSREILRFVRLLPVIAKPVVAAIDGPAVGIGTTMLLHFDLVYATPEAAFSTPFVDLALVPEAASSLLMPQRLGYALAFEMLGLGAVIPAERMREAGLVNAIVAAPDLEAMSRAAAARLAGKPREALAVTRKLMRGDPAAVLERIEAEAGAFQSRLASAEARAAFEAFLSRSRG